MARMACLAIGIGDAPPLTYLGGAVKAAEALGAWAKKAGYETKVLTDKARPVRLKDVQAAVARLLPDDVETDRLIISFAGHGVLNGLEDLWLLSQWLEENEAVSISALRRNLERYNLRQLVIISDACRKASTSSATGQLTPHPGVRRGRIADHRLQTDLFRATSSYAAAFMLRGRTDADDRCLFSSLFVEALHGAEAQAFMLRDGRQCLFSDALANWLDAAVPARAQRYGIELEPEIDPGLRFPNDLYVDELPAKPPKLAAWPDPADIASISLDSRTSGEGRLKPPPGRSWSTRDEQVPMPAALRAHPPMIAPPKAARSPGALKSASLGLKRTRPAPTHSPGAKLKTVIRRDQEAAVLQQAASEQVAASLREGFASQDRPTHFETGAGLALAGAWAHTVWLGPSARAVDVMDRTWWRIEPTGHLKGKAPPRHRLTAAPSLLVEFDDGRWAGAAALPEFIATFGVDASGVSSLVYRHMQEPDARSSEEAIAFRAAGTLSPKQLADLIVDLRSRKHQDPVLGVLACYLHDRAGDIDNIIRTAYYFARVGQPIPLDIALLARLKVGHRRSGQLTVTVPAVKAAPEREGKQAQHSYLVEATPRIAGVVAGAFPWLREGWSLLDADDDSGLYPPELAKLTGDLTPALFTTLSADGGHKLLQILMRWTGSP